MAASAEPTAQTFRDVIGRFATGVTVVTTHHDGHDHGMTASAVSSLSLQPPMLLVCINVASPTGDAVHRSRIFTINVLAEGQANLAQRFATSHADKFEGVSTARGTLGALTLTGALASIECRVVEDVAAGTHRIFIGEVAHAEAREGAPLAYFRGEFGQLHLSRRDPVYAVLRERILSGELDGVELVAATFATETGLPAGRIDRALTQLAREGLLAGDPVRGYRVAPVTPSAITDALDARCAIELGAAQLGIARATPAELDDLRTLADRTEPPIADSRAVDIAGYAAANTAFHEALVNLAGSPTLLRAYRGLSLPGILVRGLGDTGSSARTLTSALAEDHRAIARAYEARDLAAARRAIVEHTERTKATHAAATGSG
jgi:flavin reductase (DIM6/NTAB) family NADH-FMN oxidoreductase RutF/DNA-binding FadR family transcriptional regulator